VLFHGQIQVWVRAMLGPRSTDKVPMDSHAVHVGLLGPLEVTLGGRQVGPAGGRRRSLLALLALEANAVVPVQTLVDRVWGEDPPPSSANLVQTYVSVWRKALGGPGSPGADLLATVGAGYRLTLDPDQCDLVAFREAVARGRTAEAAGDLTRAAGAFATALSMWRGEPLVDLAGEPLHRRVAEPLRQERLAAVESWARASLGSGGRPRQVAAALAETRAGEPWREELTELLMWALTASGRQSEALEAFEATRVLLRDELGADPGPALAEMHGRVLRGDPGLQVGPSVQELAAMQPSSREERRLLPQQTSALVGRDGALAEVSELLAQRRLVTVLGPGGCGKTRLAAEVLDRWTEHGGAGWWVELAGLEDERLVADTMASAIGVTVSADVNAEQALATRLAGDEGLLVLDNAEHLRGLGPLVGRLIRATSRLHVLVTSREPLRVEAEQQYLLPVLDVPPDPTLVPPSVEVVSANPSVQLLVDRAQRHDPSFVPGPGNAAVLAELARLLDGLPLALEIGAAWLRLMGAEALAAYLGTNGLDVSSRVDGSPLRHRSLRDSVSWSFDLLRPAEQRLLCELSVFAGSFTLDSAEVVCHAEGGDVVGTLFDLVDRSLVQVVGTDADGQRLRLLRAVRDFAGARAAAVEGLDLPALRRRHADYMSSWAVDLACSSEGPESPLWLARAVAEADNLRLALGHLAEFGEAERHLQLVVDAMVLWFEAGMEREGLGRFAGALAAAPETTPARPIALTYWAWLRAGSHRGEAAAAAREALSLARQADDPLVEAFALQTLGDTSDDVDEAVGASRAVFEAADRAEGRPVRYGPTAPDAVRCGASYNLAARAMYRSVEDAAHWQEEALHRAELEADPRIVAVNAARLALVRLLSGDVVAASGLMDRSRTLTSTVVVSRWEDIVTYAEATLARHQGRLDDAERGLRRLWRATSSCGRSLHAVLSAVALAELQCESGHTSDAEQSLSDAERVVGRAADPAHLARIRTRRARLRHLAGDLEGAAALLAGLAGSIHGDELTPERTVWLLESAELALASGDAGAARGRLTELHEAADRTGVQLSPWDRAHAERLDLILSGRSTGSDGPGVSGELPG